MRQSLQRSIAAAVLAGVVSSAWTAPIIGSISYDPPLAIPDNNSAGVNSTINIADAGTVNSVSVQIAMTHPSVGDLVIRLTHGAKSVVLLDRPGAPPSFFGDSTNLLASFPITFIASASPLNPAEDMGSGCTNDFFDVIGSTAGCSDPLFLPQEAFDPFFGDLVNGDWILSITDIGRGETGTLASWTMTLNADEVVVVPEPASLALLGLGLTGLALTRRRLS